MGWTAPRSITASLGHDGTLDHRQQRSEERLSWKSNGIEALRAPGRAMLDDGIEDNEEFTHAGDEGNFW
jgi:hypothetical protein